MGDPVDGQNYSSALRERNDWTQVFDWLLETFGDCHITPDVDELCTIDLDNFNYENEEF